ncbi:MAG: chorismate mutase [Dehalococcoidia bacterium]|nr:chorismate mutase [Dehalococcoidia bacterium]
MFCRGIRGAITVSANDKESILDATRKLLQEMVRANEVEPESISAILFTTTPDLNAEFPAAATREIGWTQQMALLCGHEMNVPGSLPRCVRILMMVNTEKNFEDISHIYLGEAKQLLVSKTPIPGGES